MNKALPALLALLLLTAATPALADDHTVSKLTPEACLLLGDGDIVPLIVADSGSPASDEPDESFDEDFFDEGFGDELEQSESIEVNDPLEGWNRFWFGFNDTLYFGFLKPIGTGYKAITTPTMRRGVKNFFHNLLFPIRFANNLLQGRVKEAGVEFSRFFVNTTVGIAGFDDQAADRKTVVDLKDDEDTGQTLGVWGFGEGFYLVWPFLGPSSLRDTAGLAGDYFLDPLFYVKPPYIGYAGTGLNVINKTAMHLGDYEALKKASVDPYIAMREIYIKLRRQRLEK